MRWIAVPGLLGLVMPAAAQDFDTDVPSAVTVDGSANVTTDFRFRGLSQSDEHVALQGSAALRHESGLSAGLFLSSQQGRDPADPSFGQGDLRAEFFVSYRRPLASGLIGEVGITAYAFPDRVRGFATDYAEPYAALAYDLGPARARLGLAYAPGGQAALGGADSVYASGDLTVGVPTTPLTLIGHAGRTAGSLGAVTAVGVAQDYWDWSVGVEAVRGPFVASLRYVDTDVTDRAKLADRIGADATVVATFGVRF